MLTLSSPLDMHVHLRQDAMLRFTAPYTARDFAAAVIMPNLGLGGQLPVAVSLVSEYAPPKAQ